MTRTPAAFIVAILAVAGCGSDGGRTAPDLAVGSDGGVGGGGGDAPDLGYAPDLAGVATCTNGDAWCKTWNVVSACVGGAWVDTTCAGGCYAGACSASACADECALG